MFATRIVKRLSHYNERWRNDLAWKYNVIRVVGMIGVGIGSVILFNIVDKAQEENEKKLLQHLKRRNIAMTNDLHCQSDDPDDYNESRIQLAAMLRLAKNSTPSENLDFAFAAQERFMLGRASSKEDDVLQSRLRASRKEIETEIANAKEKKAAAKAEQSPYGDKDKFYK